MYFASSLSLCLLPLAVPALPSIGQREANGLISVPFTKRLAVPEGLNSRDVKATLHNGAYEYRIDVTIGTPPQSFSLVLDTGSSDIWVYASESKSSCSGCTTQYYDASNSQSIQTVNNLGVFNITYGSPNSGVTGYYASDTVTVAESPVRQVIGVATVAHSGDPKGGIFGVGLSKGESTYLHTGSVYYPGYVDTLYSNKLISQRSYSIYLNSKSADDPATGSITFGGTDSSQYTGSLVSFPLILPAPDRVFRLDIAEPSISYDLGTGSTPIPAANSNYVVLLDTGTAVSRIPTTEFNSIASAVSAQIIEEGPLYAVDCDLASKSDGVDLAFSGPKGTQTIRVPWSELAILDPTADLPDGQCVFGFAPEPEAQALGTYILGDSVLRSMYVNFDFDDESIGIAQVKYDH